MARGGELVVTMLDADENEIVNIPDSSSEDMEMALRSLRERWELASVLNFFQVFEPMIEMETKFSAEEIESALIEPNDFLAQIHKTLLKGIPPVNKMLNDHDDAWITVLCKQIAMWWQWIAEGDIPLTVNKGEEISRYKELDPTIRLQILKALCEIRADQHDTVHYINDSLKNGTEISHFRKDNIGEEKGTKYWYDGNENIGYRLYKEVTSLKSYRKSKKNSAVPPVALWETLATNLEEFHKAVNDLSCGGSKVEKAVLGTIEAEVVPILEKLQKKKEKQAKKQHRQEMLLNGFHNSRLTRPSRSCRAVSYTFDDYDKAIKEAIQVTNLRQDFSTRKQTVKKITKNASNAVSDLETNPNTDWGSDIDNAKENCKDFSGDEKNNGHSSSTLFNEVNDNGGNRNYKTRNRQKQTGNHVVAKRLLRQRPSSNAAVESIVIPDSEEESL